MPPVKSAAMALARPPARIEFNAATTLDVVVKLFARLRRRCSDP
jgi:hypothetical protein